MKKNKRVICYSILLSILFLWIGTKSSPMYPMNDWVDANAFFTMGKGLINGLVPYRDLFEQKGPILYVIYGIGYLISNRTFLGIYLLEVISLTISLIYFYKILKLYELGHQFYSSSVFLVAILLTMPAFTHGGSCEEFMLPFFTMSFYHFLWLLKDDKYKIIPSNFYLVEGMIVGIVLWTKYILLGFWIGWVFFITIFYIKEKEFKKIFVIACYYLLGILAITVPILIYFLCHGALLDMWNTYFYFNIVLYPSSSEPISFFEKISTLWKIFQQNIYKNAIFGLAISLGSISLWKDKKVLKKGKKLGIVVLFLCTFFFNYIGLKDYVYYFLVMSPFLIFFGILVAKVCSYIPLPTRYLTILFIPSLWIFVYVFSPNTYFIGVDKDSLAQFQFAKIMNQEENPTLLYYGQIDGGFYTIADIMPTEKYFEKINISYSVFPENKDSQITSIKEKKTKFVIIRLNYLQLIKNHNIPYLDENYEKVKVVTQTFEGKRFKYVLYRVKEV